VSYRPRAIVRALPPADPLGDAARAVAAVWASPAYWSRRCARAEDLVIAYVRKVAALRGELDADPGRV
jgi:hypothetical protein